MPRKKSEPRIVSTFRKLYSGSIYLNMYDNGVKIGGNKRKEFNKKWLIEKMKEFHKIRNKDKIFKKKVEE